MHAPRLASPTRPICWAVPNTLHHVSSSVRVGFSAAIPTSSWKGCGLFDEVVVRVLQSRSRCGFRQSFLYYPTIFLRCHFNFQYANPSSSKRPGSPFHFRFHTHRSRLSSRNGNCGAAKPDVTKIAQLTSSYSFDEINTVCLPTGAER